MRYRFNVIKPQVRPSPPPSHLEGGPGRIALALILGLLLAWLIAVPARPWVSSYVSDESAGGVPDQLFAIEALAGALIAVIGTLLRALAHQRSDRKNMDYLGKLFAVAALGFVLLAAQSKLLPGLSALIVTILTTAALVTIIICLCIAVWQRRRTTEAQVSPTAG